MPAIHLGGAKHSIPVAQPGLGVQDDSPYVTLALIAAIIVPSSPQPYAILNKAKEMGWKTRGVGRMAFCGF